MTDTDFKTHVKELLDDAHICMLTTLTPAGAMHSRPMAVQQAEEDADLWFFTYGDSDKVGHLLSLLDQRIGPVSESISATHTGTEEDERQIRDFLGECGDLEGVEGVDIDKSLT